MNELLPCPLCKGEARDRSHSSCDCCGKHFTGIVQCVKCGCEVSHFDTAAEAVAAWNTRPSIVGMVPEGMRGYAVLDTQGECWGGVVGNDRAAFDEAPPNRVVQVVVTVLPEAAIQDAAGRCK